VGTRIVPKVTAAQAVAFRLAAHNLGSRLPGGWLAEATTLFPIQDTAPPAGAGLSLAARVDDLVPSELERALFVNRTLVRMHSLRGVPHLVARADGLVFGPGVIGADEESLRDQLLGDWLAIESSKWTAREALAVVSGVFSATLADGEARTADELCAVLRRHIPPTLEPWCSTCRAHHVPHQLFRLAGTLGAFCYGRPVRGEPGVVSLDDWLGGPLRGGVDSARVELARRFLAAFGPTTPDHLAAWAGIGLVDARERFARLTLETLEVELDGRSAWVREEDVVALNAPPPPTGLRLLPAEDPFLAQRDRATLLPDRRHQAQVWEAQVRPGVVLFDGWPVATWQAGVDDRTLVIHVSALADRTIGVRARRALDEEAAGLAIFYMCDQARVEVLADPAG
jgi:hypothetical protein